MSFATKFPQVARRNKSLVCLGLDPDPELMPQIGILEFNRSIIDATSDLVCAYKPNLAFYEAQGIEGLTALQQTVEYISQDIPVIGDAKRSDIGNSARLYAKALFETLGFDAATVNPYLGYDSVEPFIEYQDKGVFILCHTSNPGARDFQGSLFELVAQRAKGWNKGGNVGLVVGATCPRELRQIRQLCPDMMLLIPGIGAQGGNLALAVHHGIDATKERAIFASSRQILYASREDFAHAARRATEELRQRINSLLDQGGAKMAEEVEVGKVSDFFARPVVAGIQLTANLKVGDKIHIKGHTTDLECVINSMQINNVDVNEGKPGDSIGVKMPDRVRRGDAVYKVVE
jgi:orotidine-5'-phosphate decarboxylase